MSEIHECLTVLCPFEQTPAAAAAYVASLQTENDAHTIPIRMNVGDLTVERRVDIKIKHSRAYPGFEIMEIAWKPHEGGPYPIFRGTLSVEDVGGNFSRLDLDGAYDPPLGIVGAAFDAVVGHRIAVAGARQLLEEIKNGMELAFQTGATVP
jgi:hypothetical protein